MEGERLAKRMARAGLCSRREAETWIECGRVSVNDKKITTPAFNVTESDVVKVNGRPLEAKEKAQLWLYHKPAGLVTTHKDPQGRPTVFDQLPKHLPRVISIGRLDLNSEGLLLLTNDGDLARKLELPANEWVRSYRVRIFGSVTSNMLIQMKRGLTIDGVKYGSIDVVAEEKEKTAGNSWFVVSLKEGKNREIRKIFEFFHCRISRLIRLSYGPFNLGSLPKGDVREAPGKALKSILEK